MKRLVGVLLLLLLVFIITSCGALSNEDLGVFDGDVYNYECDLEVNGTIYDVYLPENFKDYLYYSFSEGELTSESESWTLNFDHEIVYRSSEEFDFNEEFYNYVLSLKSKLDSESINYELLPNRTVVECEFNIDNPNKELLGYGVLVSYIPLKLMNKGTIYVLVPINTDVLKMKNDLIETIEKDDFIPYEQFLRNEKLIEL